MKHLILALVVVILTAFTTTSDSASPVDPVYTLTLSPQQAQTLLYVIEKSAAEHNVVIEVQRVVLPQLQAQTDAMQKATSVPPADSTKPAKKGKN